MNKPRCVAPWKGLCIDFDGNVLPDGIYKKPLGNLNNSTLQEIWNSPNWKKLREDNINLDINAGCNHCANKEKLSGHSRRMFFETFFSSKLSKEDVELSTSYLKYDAWRPKVTDYNKPDFIFLDITSSNKCNLKCIHCSSRVSTAWKADDKKLTQVSSQWNELRSVDGYSVISDDIIDNIFKEEQYLQNLKFVSLRGGEPLYEPQNIKIIKKLVDLGWSQNIVIDISTNGTIDDDLLYNLLSKFKGLIFYISIEGSNDLYSYCRGGELYNFDVVSRCINRLSNLPNTQEICLTYTTMAPNIFDIRNTWEYIKQYSDICTYSFGNTVSSPSYLSLDVLDRNMKEKALRLLEGMPEVLEVGNNTPYSLGIESLKESLSKDLHPKQQYLWNTFKDYINNLDKIRNTNFLEVEPHYKEYWYE